MIMKRLTRHSNTCHLVVLLVIIFLNKTKELPFVLIIPFFGQDFRQDSKLGLMNSLHGLSQRTENLDLRKSEQSLNILAEVSVYLFKH